MGDRRSMPRSTPAHSSARKAGRRTHNSRRRSASLARLAPALCWSPVMSPSDKSIHGPPRNAKQPQRCERGGCSKQFRCGSMRALCYHTPAWSGSQFADADRLTSMAVSTMRHGKSSRKLWSSISRRWLYASPRSPRMCAAWTERLSRSDLRFTGASWPRCVASGHNEPAQRPFKLGHLDHSKVKLRRKWRLAPETKEIVDDAIFRSTRAAGDFARSAKCNLFPLR